MKKLWPLLILGLSGCGAIHKAQGGCTYNGGTPSRYGGWISDPEQKCNFAIDTKLKKVEDASVFAKAFKTIHDTIRYNVKESSDTKGGL